MSAQICNICLGLGLPWMLASLTGHRVAVRQHAALQKDAFFQAGLVALFFLSTIGLAWARGLNKAELTAAKGYFFIVVYFAVLTVLALMQFTGGG